MISLVLWALASVCNAVMDTLAHHFYVSVFQKKDPKFWNPEVSWKEVGYLPFTKFKADAWHLVKSLMIILIALAICFKPYWVKTGMDIIMYLILLGVVWNGTFSLFYNKLLKYHGKRDPGDY